MPRVWPSIGLVRYFTGAEFPSQRLGIAGGPSGTEAL
jgi:hypothetical protein